MHTNSEELVSFLATAVYAAADYIDLLITTRFLGGYIGIFVFCELPRGR